MRQEPLISVIVPVFNTAQFLRECIDGIRAQTYRNIEIILIDDGSTDSSTEICRQYEAADNRIQAIIRAANRGQSSARNTGLDAAHGQYVTFVDSDDIVSPRLIETLYKAIVKSDAQLAATALARFHKQPTQTEVQEQFGICTARKALTDMLYQIGFNPSVCGKLFTRSSIGDMRFEEDLLYEDLDFMARYLTSISTVTRSLSRLYHYRRNPASTLGTFRVKRLDVLTVTERIVRQTKTDADLHMAACDRHLSAAFNMYALLCRNNLQKGPDALRCWNIIRDIRFKSLFNRHVRIKNKIGVLASLSGAKGLSFIARHTTT